MVVYGGGGSVLIILHSNVQGIVGVSGQGGGGGRKGTAKSKAATDKCSQRWQVERQGQRDKRQSGRCLTTAHNSHQVPMRSLFSSSLARTQSPTNITTHTLHFVFVSPKQ